MKKLSTALLGAASLATAAAATPPNIVIIMADDIGFGDLSCNIPEGSKKTIETPNVDRLAARGIRFTNAHTTASTSTPSRYSVLTGEYAWRRPGTGVAPGDAAMIVTPDRATLPGMLQKAGYRTAAIGKWHLGLGDKQGKQNWNGLITPGLSDIGFDYSYIMAATGDRVPCVFIEQGRAVGLDLANHPEDSIFVSYSTPFEGEPTGRKNPEMLRLKSSHGHDNALINGIGRIGFMKGGGKALWDDRNIADSITAHALQFIEREANKETPFFLYFCTNDIHVPRDPHPRFVGKSGMGVRGDALLQFDWSVGRVLDVLDSLGVADNTLVILTSDNGPVVDDGYADQAVELLGDHLPAGELRGNKYSNFEGGTRVPFIASWPTKGKKQYRAALKQGSLSNAAISQVDLYATLAALTSGTIDPAKSEAPDSYNILETMRGASPVGRPHIVENAGSLSIISPDGWKYIAPSNGGAYDKATNTELGNLKAPQLYNLNSDIGERNNVAADHPELVQTLAAKLEIVKKTPDGGR